MLAVREGLSKKVTWNTCENIGGRNLGTAFQPEGAAGGGDVWRLGPCWVWRPGVGADVP